VRRFTHQVGPNGSLTQKSKGIIPSIIFWVHGTGKTTLAQIIAQESKRPFIF
jgi:putative ATPase